MTANTEISTSNLVGTTVQPCQKLPQFVCLSLRLLSSRFDAKWTGDTSGDRSGGGGLETPDRTRGFPETMWFFAVALLFSSGVGADVVNDGDEVIEDPVSTAALIDQAGDCHSQSCGEKGFRYLICGANGQSITNRSKPRTRTLH